MLSKYNCQSQFVSHLLGNKGLKNSCEAARSKPLKVHILQAMWDLHFNTCKTIGFVHVHKLTPSMLITYNTEQCIAVYSLQYGLTKVGRNLLVKIL